MNDDDLDRRDDRAPAPTTDGERPAVIAYDPYFPAVRPHADDARPGAYDPYFPQDGASDFD